MVSLKEITEFYKSKLIDTTEAAENIRAEKLRVSTNASIFRSSKKEDIIDYEGHIFSIFLECHRIATGRSFEINFIQTYGPHIFGTHGPDII